MTAASIAPACCFSHSTHDALSLERRSRSHYSVWASPLFEPAPQPAQPFAFLVRRYTSVIFSNSETCRRHSSVTNVSPSCLRGFPTRSCSSPPASFCPLENTRVCLTDGESVQSRPPAASRRTSRLRECATRLDDALAWRRGNIASQVPS